MWRVALLLVLRYRLVDATSCTLQHDGSSSPISFSKPADSPQAFGCLLQKHFARVPQPVVVERLVTGAAQARVVSLLSVNASEAFTNPESAARAIDNPDIPHGDTDASGQPVHHSIFELSFAQVDRRSFWFVFCCMLVFTIIVDRVEALAVYKAGESRSEQMFITRINAELMMFGCVGLFLFALSNVTDLSMDQDVIVEFVDILCSMGACGLILIAAVLFVMRSYCNSMWKKLQEVDLAEADITSLEPIDRRASSVRTMSPVDYQIMAKRFMISNTLPDEFDYTAYLNQVLTGNACDIMDIHWYTWLCMLILVALMFAIRAYRGTHFQNSVYIVGFSIANWLMLVCFCVLLWIVEGGHAILMTEIQKDQDQLQAKGTKVGAQLKSRKSFKKLISDPPMAWGLHIDRQKGIHVDRSTDNWARAIKFFMQFLALMNSFLLSLYFMHLQFNLKAAGLHWVWRPMLLLPLVISLFVLVPAITARFALVDAFFLPDGDAIDTTMQMLVQLNEDFELIRTMWEARGKPDFPEMGGEGVDEVGLGQVLRDLGIHTAKARHHRIFMALDEDKGGTVTTDELMKRLEESDTPTNRSSAASSVSVGSHSSVSQWLGASIGGGTFSFRQYKRMSTVSEGCSPGTALNAADSVSL